MTPAQPPAERPGVVCRCGKPGRAGGPAPRPRRRAVRGGAGASYRAAPASSSPETATVEVNPPASTARNPAAAPVLRGLPGAPGDRPGRHYPGQPGGGDHHAGHGPPGQRYTGGSQQSPLCRRPATQPPPQRPLPARTRAARPRARTRPAHRWPRQGRGPQPPPPPRCQSPHPGLPRRDAGRTRSPVRTATRSAAVSRAASPPRAGSRRARKHPLT